MARQVIFVSQPVLEIFSGQLAVQEHEHSPLFQIQPLHRLRDSLAVKVSLPELGYGTPTSMPFSDFVLVMTSRPEPDPQFRPLPLPDDIVGTILDQFTRAIAAAIDDLSGHDAMELAEALDAARTGTLNWPTLHRQPNNAYEAGLVKVAAEMQAMLQAQLTSLDAQHASLRDAAIRQRLLQPMRSLACTGPIADALHLGLDARPQGQSQIGSQFARAIMDGRRRAEKDGNVYYQSMCRHMTRLDLSGTELRPFRLVELFEAALTGSERPGAHWLWRNYECPQHQSLEHSVAVADIEEAMMACMAAFDCKLLGSMHPVIRAALAMYELLRIEPAAENNELVASYVLVSMLDAGGFFSLPLPLLLHRRRNAVVDALRDALQIGSAHGFVSEIVLLCEKAIEIGEHMLATLLPWRDRIVTHLTHDGIPAREAGKLADLVTGAPLLERISLTALSEDDWRDSGPSLQATGYLDSLEIDGDLWWSPTLPRKLVSSLAC